MNQETTQRLIESLKSRAENAERTSAAHIAEAAHNEALYKSEKKATNAALIIAAFFFVTTCFLFYHNHRISRQFAEAMESPEKLAESVTLKHIATADSVFNETRLLYPTDTLKMIAQGPSGEIFKIFVVDCFECEQP
jgi:hypothetical protein